MGAGKIAVGLIKGYMRLVYRPRFTYADESLQTENFDKPSVIIANHCDHRDAVFLMASLGGKISTLTARDWYEKPQYKWVLKDAGCIPCDRGGLDTEWLREAREAIANGRSVLIFPEGHTRHDGEMSEFKSGFALLAVMTSAPVVCIGLSGKYRKFRHTYACIGTPTPTERTLHIDSKSLAQESAAYREKVDNLRRRAGAVCAAVPAAERADVGADNKENETKERAEI